MELILFGSSHCPFCGPFKKQMEDKGLNFEYVDITENMMNLKKFLKFRDGKDEFKPVRENGKVGIPCVVVNSGEKILFNLNEL